MTELKLLSVDEKLAEIRRLYFQTTRQTIQRDLERALGLLKSMSTEEQRERATVYMEGLAEMNKDWLRSAGRKKGKGARAKGKGQRA
ncbi:MAG: hypothetical protein A3H97_08110 [Acidobacteria bacterium RIFCSPLOWO2_02_FULL_65_29]|nr:MAG: hypothetical protein A3H97_08110 [Acidobacteria bacterium RIFCSPLOWO2_02_FULL_65_29]